MTATAQIVCRTQSAIVRLLQRKGNLLFRVPRFFMFKHLARKLQRTGGSRSELEKTAGMSVSIHDTRTNYRWGVTSLLNVVEAKLEL